MDLHIKLIDNASILQNLQMETMGGGSTPRRNGVWHRYALGLLGSQFNSFLRRRAFWSLLNGFWSIRIGRIHWWFVVLSCSQGWGIRVGRSGIFRRRRAHGGFHFRWRRGWISLQGSGIGIPWRRGGRVSWRWRSHGSRHLSGLKVTAGESLWKSGSMLYISSHWPPPAGVSLTTCRCRRWHVCALRWKLKIRTYPRRY